MADQHHLLSVLVENKFGVLTRVAGLFARRGAVVEGIGMTPYRRYRFYERAVR